MPWVPSKRTYEDTESSASEYDALSKEIDDVILSSSMRKDAISRTKATDFHEFIGNSLTLYETLYRFKAAEPILNEIILRAKHIANSRQVILENSGLFLEKEALLAMAFSTAYRQRTTAGSGTASTSTNFAVGPSDLKGIYVHGPHGVGKSHVLLQIATYLRLTEPTYRVIYINDCKTWYALKSYGKRFRFLLRDIIMAFPDDSEVHSLVKEFYDVSYSYRKYDLNEETGIFLNKLNNLCTDEKLIPIWIIDNLEELKEDKVEYPFVVYQTVLRLFGRVVVLCASSNNAITPPYGISGFKPYQFMTPFNDTEAKVFIEKRFADVAWVIDTTPSKCAAFPTEQVLDVMREITLFYPYLLSGLCEHLISLAKRGYLSQVSESIRLRRVKARAKAFLTSARGEIEENHLKFLKGNFGLVDVDKVKVAAIAAIMDIGIEAGSYTIDRNFSIRSLKKGFEPTTAAISMTFSNHSDRPHLMVVWWALDFVRKSNGSFYKKPKPLGVSNLTRLNLYSLEEDSVDTIDISSVNPFARHPKLFNHLFDTLEQRSKNYLLIPATETYKAINYAILHRGPSAQSDELVLLQVKMTSPEKFIEELKTWNIYEACMLCEHYIDDDFTKLRIVFLLRPASYAEILEQEQYIHIEECSTFIYSDGHHTREVNFEVASVADIEGFDFITSAKLSNGSYF
ncbi:uncharacterized protein VTP21DRAFT_3164 [Calcarisporiella thermophila]|uniref:uncharacterized protein n=1 Tax=Calcarisporiella thermophila TaxID=911321 RepID=UPI0037421FC4